MSAPSRCHDCGHRRQRIVTAKKKPCDCGCHRAIPAVVEVEAEASTRRGRSMPSWFEPYEVVA